MSRDSSGATCRELRVCSLDRDGVAATRNANVTPQRTTETAIPFETLTSPPFSGDYFLDFHSFADGTASSTGLTWRNRQPSGFSQARGPGPYLPPARRAPSLPMGQIGAELHENQGELATIAPQLELSPMAATERTQILYTARMARSSIADGSTRRAATASRWVSPPTG